MSLAMPSMAQVTSPSSSEACNMALQVTELASADITGYLMLPPEVSANHAGHKKRAIANVCPRTPSCSDGSTPTDACQGPKRPEGQAKC